MPEDGKPNAWIQWKGTKVCMDVRCPCGRLGHVDGQAAYYIECPDCHRVYFVNGHVELVELDEHERMLVDVNELQVLKS